MGAARSLCDWQPVEDELAAGMSAGLGGPTFQQLVYIDRDFVQSAKEAAASSRSTVVGSGVSEESTRFSTKAMLVLQTASAQSKLPSQLDRSKVRKFQSSIEQQGLDVSRWGDQGSKALDQLYWETMEQRGCHFVKGSDGRLERVVRLVKVKLVADIFGVEHTLYSRMQFMHDGQQVERKQVLLRKLRWRIHPDDDTLSAGDIKGEECQHTEDWREGARTALEERLGLSQAWQQSCLVEDVHAHTFHREENVKSDGYPGLNTSYCIHWIALRVVDPCSQAVSCIGLPNGLEFASCDNDFCFGTQGMDDLGLPIGSQLNIWTWEREKKDVTTSVARPLPKRSPTSGVPEAHLTEVARFVKRVPLPAVSAQALSDLQRKLSSSLKFMPPSSSLCSAMEGKETDWAKAKKIAQSLLDRKYTLAKFSEDLAAFPELHLYLLDHAKQPTDDDAHEAAGMAMMSSGRTIGDEYQRTIGTFYAIFWLLRLHMDGKEGFCFGVDEDWVPHSSKAVNDVYLADKRLLFFQKGNWSYFGQLMRDAKLISEDGWGRAKVNEKRVVSLLALTAIHDIMKMDIILPQVQQQHSPFRGYTVGDTIGDHDHALSYIMAYYPHLLPSFRGLGEDERRAVEFTQCRLQFNHGWFVQGEAPPGAVFTCFKEVLKAESVHGRIKKEDLALYFVHWLTDLAGAEPTPLGGCEKFVIKFPMVVLNSFLRSFEFVERIVDETETQVMEEYLKMRWCESVPSPGELPTGDGAVAKMRLLCMAQMNAGLVLRAVDEVCTEDREVLYAEMALTGCAGQLYSAGICPKEVRERPYGPAFLIYYGPAFLQNMGNDSPAAKIRMLAEIYRLARIIWPAQAEKVAQYVTIRIDCIKEISVADIRKATLSGDKWVIVKRNETEAFVERSSQRRLNKMIRARQQMQILEVSKFDADPS